ncbi:AAA family ATPase [Rhodopirellula sallentina]|uniref:Putative P-loop ATPase n=1 Tax=Rhodopirellula sallentina SM41 TaxID=1263870 RepID=M5UKN7_9BACT|nr:ATP-binding protein [Rhodopirellula sallentina]EMI56578.1 putative P-loop ATPase [Rhodopirellula sallentina SM41]
MTELSPIPRENNPNTLALHIVTGAAGVGKSTFGKHLAVELGAVFLDSDTVTEPVVRAGLTAAGLDPTDRDSPEYKRLFRDAVYECLFATAAENLTHTSVVIVGPFTRELRDANWPKHLHNRFGVQPTIWHVTCSDVLRRERIMKRGNPRDRAKLIDWAQHIADAPPAQPAFEVNLVDTSRSR